jgi:hypothetical protein
LGDADVAVRVAGVYGMAAVADESATFAHRQQCIDVLCGYLRLPYDPDWGSSRLSEFVSTTTWSATPPAINIEEQRRQAIRQNDREVRKTIIRVVSRHLQGNADTSWSGNDFDFTGVLFEDTSFDKVRFAGEYVSFARAGFSARNPRSSRQSSRASVPRSSRPRSGRTSSSTGTMPRQGVRMSFPAA